MVSVSVNRLVIKHTLSVNFIVVISKHFWSFQTSFQNKFWYLNESRSEMFLPSSHPWPSSPQRSSHSFSFIILRSFTPSHLGVLSRCHYFSFENSNLSSNKANNPSFPSYKSYKGSQHTQDNKSKTICLISKFVSISKDFKNGKNCLHSSTPKQLRYAAVAMCYASVARCYTSVAFVTHLAEFVMHMEQLLCIWQRCVTHLESVVFWVFWPPNHPNKLNGHWHQFLKLLQQ